MIGQILKTKIREDKEEEYIPSVAEKVNNRPTSLRK